MRKTLLAVGVAILVSMMVAPHGGKHGIEGWARSFPHKGLIYQGEFGTATLAK
jgi:hypothetical protein